MIWFFSDPHFAHKNICEGTSSWEGKRGCRPFKDPDEMGNLIVENLNSKVGKDDELICGGDWSFSSIQNAFYWREKIRCRNIHLVLGNHDGKHGTVFDPVWNNKHVSSLFKSYGHYKEFYHNKTLICVFHFPIQSWNSMSKGAIHLHGHTHRSPQEKFINGGKSMDIGLDGNNYNPYSIDEIFEIMNDLPTRKEGHHE